MKTNLSKEYSSNKHLDKDMNSSYLAYDKSIVIIKKASRKNGFQYPLHYKLILTYIYISLHTFYFYGTLIPIIEGVWLKVFAVII